MGVGSEEDAQIGAAPEGSDCGDAGQKGTGNGRAAALEEEEEDEEGEEEETEDEDEDEAKDRDAASARMAGSERKKPLCPRYSSTDARLVVC
jgi:hypothetical protein